MRRCSRANTGAGLFWQSDGKMKQSRQSGQRETHGEGEGKANLLSEDDDGNIALRIWRISNPRGWGGGFEVGVNEEVTQPLSSEM